MFLLVSHIKLFRKETCLITGHQGADLESMITGHKGADFVGMITGHKAAD